MLLVELPRRGAFGSGNGPEIVMRARSAMQHVPEVRDWVIAGHSLGGAVAARLVHEDETSVAGLALIGTSHPRRFSLANLHVPVVKILGSRDGLAGPEKSAKTRPNLPASTRWVVIEGANHSQFGCYGFQPGDRTARISRDQQQALTVQALLESLTDSLAP